MTIEMRSKIRLLKALNYADVIKVPDELITSGNIGDEQVKVTTAITMHNNHCDEYLKLNINDEQAIYVGCPE